MPKLIDLTGKKFEKLTVIKRVGTKQGSPLWLCECECGNSMFVITRSLMTGNTKSCGCIHAKQLSDRNRSNSKHSGESERLYGIWHAMKQRCYYKKRRDYMYYGQRGIIVCKEWLDDYSEFRSWALAHGYNPNAKYMGCTLDRINTNGNYCPENCRWVDAKTQANNRRTENVRRNSDGTFKRTS